MQKSQDNKLTKQGLMTKLHTHLVRKAYISRKDQNGYKFTSIPGICRLRNEIDRLLIQPIITPGEFDSNKLLIRGPSGAGKTFILKAISNEFNIALIKTKYNDLLEGIQNSRAHGKCMVVITDLDCIEDKADVHALKEILSKTGDAFIVAEVTEKVDEKLRKFECFENEIFVDVSSELERKDVLNWLYVEAKKRLKQDIKCAEFTNIIKLTPGLLPSDLCKLTRRAVLKSIALKEDLCETHFFTAIKDLHIKLCNITFDDIGGLKNAKEEIYNLIILPLTQREKYMKWNIKISAGILLYGPPGCGKTLLARSVANLGHYNFISIKGPEIINKYVGNTEKAIREIFENAKQQQPCIIFFDEIDSLCQRRGNGDFNDRIVNQLLTMMDGFDDRGEVFIIAATNRPELIDQAFLRPGRFDRMIQIPLPSLDERCEIFKKHTREIQNEEFKFAEIDTENFTGADIQGMIKEACVMFLREGGEDKEIAKVYFERAAEERKNMLKK